MTELEQNIKFGVERYVKVEKELEELKQKVDNNFFISKRLIVKEKMNITILQRKRISNYDD